MWVDQEGVMCYLLCHNISTAFFLDLRKCKLPRDGSNDVIGDEGSGDGGSNGKHEGRAKVHTHNRIPSRGKIRKRALENMCLR